MSDLTVDATAHRDSYPMGNKHHGTTERPDWGTFCVECKGSWPCDVSILADRLAAVQAEVERLRGQIRDREANGAEKRAEHAESERDAARAEVEALRERVGALVDESLSRPQPGYVSTFALRDALDAAR